MGKKARAYKGLTSSDFKFEPANPIQDAFIWCTTRESVFDGGVANGKTTGALVKLLLLMQHFPGSRYVVARQTYKDLTSTTRRTFIDKVCPPQWIARDVKESTTLHNGSEIEWRHLDDESEGSLRGLEINGAYVDQPEEVSPEMWEMLDSRIGRWSRPEWKEPCPPYIWGTPNPAGHDWIYFRFHPDCSPPSHRAYFFAPTGTNKALLDKVAPGYYEMLMRKPEAFKRRWVYGSRDTYEGQIHPEFSKVTHVYDATKFDPFSRLISGCMGAFNAGFSTPTSLLLVYSTPDGFHFVTREYYERDGRISYHSERAKGIIGASRHKVKFLLASPDMFKEETKDKRVRYTSVAKEYATEGLYFTKADGNEITSISSLHELFNIDKSLRNPVTGEMGSPRLFISSSCKHLIEEVIMQRYSEGRNVLTGEKEFTDERNPAIPSFAYDPLRFFANSKLWQVGARREQWAIPTYSAGRKVEKQDKRGYEQHSNSLQ